MNGVTITGNIGTPGKPTADVAPNGVLNTPCVVEEVFKTELFAKGGKGVTLAFKVQDNIPYDIDMYFSETFLTADTIQERVFDVQINGATYIQGLNVR